eukprot:Gb_25643 [translate_table: standard]
MLSHKNDESKWEITAAGGIPPLVHILETRSSKAKEDSITVLGNLWALASTLMIYDGNEESTKASNPIFIEHVRKSKRNYSSARKLKITEAFARDIILGMRKDKKEKRVQTLERKVSSGQTMGDGDALTKRQEEEAKHRKKEQEDVVANGIHFEGLTNTKESTLALKNAKMYGYKWQMGLMLMEGVTTEEIHIAMEKIKAISSSLSCVRNTVDKKGVDRMKTATSHEFPCVFKQLAKGSDTKLEYNDYYVEAKAKVGALVEIFNQWLRHLREFQQEKGLPPFKKKTASVVGSISSSISSMGLRASSPDIDDEKLLGKTRDGNVKESNRSHVSDLNSKASGHVVSTPCTYSRSNNMEHGTPNGHEPVDELTEDAMDIGVPNSTISLGGNNVAGTTGYIDGKLLEETSIGDLNEEEEKPSDKGDG